MEAQRAHLVANSDAHLEGINNRITVAAYSKELNTSLTSEHSGNHEVDVAINAYADAPYLSVDASVRGLVNDNLAPELQSKAFIKVPASAALSDTDGSESLWIRITPNGADISQFFLPELTILVQATTAILLLELAMFLA